MADHLQTFPSSLYLGLMARIVVTLSVRHSRKHIYFLNYIYFYHLDYQSKTSLLQCMFRSFDKATCAMSSRYHSEFRSFVVLIIYTPCFLFAGTGQRILAATNMSNAIHVVRGTTTCFMPAVSCSYCRQQLMTCTK